MPTNLHTSRQAVATRLYRLMFDPPASDSDVELVNQALDRCEEQIHEEKQLMRCGDWWHGLDELDDAGNRRSDELWEPVDDDLERGLELADDASVIDDWQWDYTDEVPR